MLDVEGHKRLRCLGQVAILAPFQSLTANKPSRRRIHQAFGCRARTERAWACKMLITSMAST